METKFDCHIHNVVSTLPNVAEIDIEIDNVVQRF